MVGQSGAGLFARPETHGVEALLSGWHAAGLSDAELERAGLTLLDGLYGRFRSGALGGEW